MTAMNADDYLKVILSGLASYLFFQAFTPRHPPMDANQRDENFNNVMMENRFWTHHMVIVKATTQLLIGFAEITLLLNKIYPSISFSHVTQNLFLFDGGDLNHLHLTPLHTIGGVLMVIGAAIRISAINALGKFFRFQVGIQKDHRLITHGLYSVVRHPAYMGMQMTHIGSLLWNLTPGSWVRESGVLSSTTGAVLVAAYFGFIVCTFYMITIARMKQEDKVIQQTFGKEWEEWARRVPYKVMPGVY